VVSRPITPTATWVLVTDRAGRRCECVGQCGSKHYTYVAGKPAPPLGSPVRRCRAELHTGPHSSPEHGGLFVAPTDPSVSPDDAWRVPVAELAAWCAHCLDGVRARARKVARTAARAAETVDLGPAAELPADGDYAALFDAAPYRDLTAGGRRRAGRVTS
jgi:hypothetical protein